MRTFLEKRLSLSAIGAGLVCVAVGSIAGGFGNYFPPDFRSDFLLGRQAYFYGSYRWAFYTHILAGPISLLAGLVLLSTSARQAFPKAHRLVGACPSILGVSCGAERTLDGLVCSRWSPYRCGIRHTRASNGSLHRHGMAGSPLATIGRTPPLDEALLCLARIGCRAATDGWLGR